MIEGTRYRWWTSRYARGFPLLGVAVIAVVPGLVRGHPIESRAPGMASFRGADTTVVLVIEPLETEARYRVREQLVRLDFPNDAVGATRAVSGTLEFEGDGRLSSRSRFVVDLRTLTSDRDRRDNFLRQNTLQTDRFPEAILEPTELIGIEVPLPTSGEASFQLVGDLTIHGVTRRSVWDVAARFDGAEVRGLAATRFAFGDHDIEIPRLALILSIEDDIRLELDFHFVPADAGGAH